MKTAVFQRDAFIEEIFCAAREDRNIFFLSADFGALALDDFREQLPNQFIHCGISEQNMIDVASGLALSEKKVYAYAMAPFITLRCLEQIKCSLAQMNLPVTLLAIGVGLGYADAGPTHYTTEDLACVRSIAGLEVISPSDHISARAIARHTLREDGLRIIRMDREILPTIYSTDFSITDHGYTELESGNEICVLSYGYLLHRVLKARKEMDGTFGVIDLYRQKPISSDLIETLKKYLAIVTIEEQCLQGGFGSAVLEAISDYGLNMQVKRLGLPERYYFENGGRDYLLDRFGLSVANIKNIIEELAS